MTTTFKKKALASALAAAVIGMPTLAQAAINFDPDGVFGGTGAAINDRWVWQFTTFLLDDGLQSPSGAYANQAATILVQGQGLTATQGANIVFGSAQMGNITFEMSIPVLVSRNGTDTLISWTDQAGTNGAPNNYFRIFYDGPGGGGAGTPNYAAGTGFNDGLVILDGTVRLDPNQLNQLQVVNAALAPLGPTASAQSVALSGNLNALIDVCEAAEVGVDPQCTVANTYRSDFFVNTSFFGPALTFDVNFGGQLAAPFGGVPNANPVPNTVAGVTPNLDRAPGSGTDSPTAINDLSCGGLVGSTLCDVIADASKPGSGQPNTTWQGTIVPAPGTLALLGISLLGFGAASRRRRV